MASPDPDPGTLREAGVKQRRGHRSYLVAFLTAFLSCRKNIGSVRFVLKYSRKKAVHVSMCVCVLGRGDK